jgi:membrane-associated protein
VTAGLLLAALEALGPWMLLGVAVVIFIESGVLFPFLPGDSLLVAVAVFAPHAGLSVWQVALVGAAAAVAGDQAGYWLGGRYGRRLFQPDARVLKAAHVDRAEAFFAKYGAAALILGRFVPIVRTYVPLAAGIARMRYWHFTVWNVVGGVAWSTTMVIVGTFLGRIPFVARNIDVLMVVVVAVSILPVGAAVLRRHIKARAAARATDVPERQVQ